MTPNQQDERTGLFIFMVAVIVALIFVAASFAPSRAHDGHRPDLDSWFNRLQSGKGLCCSNNDGTALSDVDWESRAGKYRVRIDGQWIDVPDDAVITEPNLAGRTMVWPLRGMLGLTIRCFMPGSMT